jgi:hypothetical protein
MKSRKIVTGLVFAGVAALAGGASADSTPYGMWQAEVNVDESFNRSKSVDRSIDGSFNTDVRKTEDNDITTIVSEDNDITKDLRWNYESTSSWASSVDTRYDATKVGDLNSKKNQDLDAGHEASQYVGGSATGPTTDTQGGDVFLSLGNDYGSGFKPVINTADATTVVAGDSNAPILTKQVLAGGSIIDLSGSAFGNTTSYLEGDVLQSSGAVSDQSGDSANSIQDPMSVSVQR